MADAHAKHHDYHLVNPSPWPIVGSLSAFVMAVGAIGWMKSMFTGGPMSSARPTPAITPAWCSCITVTA